MILRLKEQCNPIYVLISFPTRCIGIGIQFTLTTGHFLCSDALNKNSIEMILFMHKSKLESNHGHFE